MLISGFRAGVQGWVGLQYLYVYENPEIPVPPDLGKPTQRGRVGGGFRISEFHVRVWELKGGPPVDVVEIKL